MQPKVRKKSASVDSDIPFMILPFFNWKAFCTGTAAEVVPIARLATGADEEPFEKVFTHGQKLPGGPITSALLTLLRQVMIGEKTSKGTEGWLRNPYDAPEVFCKE